MTEKNGSFDIKGYLAVIREKRYLALAVGLAVLSIIVWGGYMGPKTYEADSTIVVQKGLLMQPFMRQSGLAGTIEDELRILKNSLTSRSIVDRVLKKLDMDLKAKNMARYEALIHKVQSRLNVITVQGQNNNVELFTISYESSNPKEARDIVNTLVDEYLEQSISTRRTDALNAYDFLNSQLLSLKGKLDESDQQIMDFRKKHPEIDMQADSESARDQSSNGLSALQSAAMESDIKLKDLLRRQKGLEMELSGKKKLTADSNDGTVSPLQSRLDKLNSELMSLTTRYTGNYPDVIKVKAEIASLKKQMENPLPVSGRSGNPVYQQTKDELAQTNSEIADLKERVAEISKQERSMDVSLGGRPEEQADWSKLQRDRGTYQKMYDDTLQRLEAAKASKDIQMGADSSLLKVVDPAVLPVIPVKPDMVIFIAAGLLLGLASGIGSVIGLDLLQNPYRDEESVEKGLKMPVLISISRISGQEDRDVSRRKDLKIFGVAGVYVLLICVLLIREVIFRATGTRIGPF
ncbi:MAG: hypothetical protein M0Z61_13645 [Nitrospiraceae bacterium]|nr:hypothetical protein [Nitrospiraceae bacterium]